MSYLPSERETTLQIDDESKVWKVTSYQSPFQTKMKRLGIEPERVDSDGGCHYTLNINQVSFRSGKKRNVSEAQRQAASERFKAYHEEKKKEQ